MLHIFFDQIRATSNCSTPTPTTSGSSLTNIQKVVPLTPAYNYFNPSPRNPLPAKIPPLRSKAPYASRIARWVRPARSMTAILITFTLSVAIGMKTAVCIAQYVEKCCIAPIPTCSCSYLLHDSIRERIPRD
ncbi:unnamed protein product [Strongylus vulgaris]|uniref:Uncharacterized protein n=1 Tax=Strongylus vulgaris TaxID=40348 RepID=A0A3P7IR21_STRVU|nr:unnamed protein product [Strongylus vulgaris]